jgi:hypothetical protein
MAVRIQFRRGTAAEWASANPTLVAGELGYEVDTAKFKIGDGSTVWASLDYAGVNQQDIEDAVANVIDFAPEDLNTLVELASAIGDDPDFINTINNTITSTNSDTVVYVNQQVASAQANAQSFATNAIANLIDSAPGTLDTLNELSAALGDDPNFATTVTNSIANRIEFVADTAANFASSNPVIGAQVFAIDTDTRKVKVGNGVLDWANVNYVGEDLVQIHNNDTSVHGISNTLNLVYQDELDAVESSLQNNITDVNSAIQDTTNQLANVTTSFGTTTNAISDAVDALDVRVDTLEGTSTSQGSSITSLTSSVNGLDSRANTLEQTTTTLTSSVENLENGAAELNTTVLTLAPLSGAELTSPTISGASLEGATTLAVAATFEGLSPTEFGYFSGVTSGIQSQIDNKADLDSPSFTGNVVLPVTTTIGNVVGTEISSLENVSSNIQDQLNAKLGTISAESIYAPLSGPTFTGNVSLPSTTSIGSVSETEIGYLSGLIAPIQDQLTTRATTESPTFTGIVSGITASMVGLTNVDNTSDLDKPVSNATQTALDAKLDLAGGTMTGKITLDGDPTQALHAVTKQYVDSVEAGLITRPSVRAATTGPLPSEGTSVTYDNGTAGVGATLNLGQLASLDIDGITLWDLLDGILVKDQDNKFENGRYVVDQIGNGTDTDWILRRCSLCDTADEIPGSYIFVLDGTTNEQTGWVQHVADPATFTVGTDDIDVYQFAGAGAITAGNNISVSGNEISVISEPSFDNATVTNILTVGSGGMGGLTFPDGTVQSSAGVPSLTQFTEQTSNYTLDGVFYQDNVIEMNSSSALTFTIPTNNDLAWPIGASMDIIQTGTGQVTIANAVGVTLNSTPGKKLRTQWSSCTIMKRGTDSWILYGDLTA